MEDEKSVVFAQMIYNIKEKHKRFGFNSWEDILDYIKEGNTVYNGNNTLHYDNEKKQVVFSNEVGDATGSFFWTEYSYYEDDTFLNVFKHRTSFGKALCGRDDTYLDQWIRVRDYDEKNKILIF